MMLEVLGAGLVIAAGVTGYAWRKSFIGRLRVIGGVVVICLPALVFGGIMIWSGAADKAHAFHALPPENGVSVFEAMMMVTIGIAPFWSFGALCGYMLRSFQDRPSSL